jgi:hypothetical protein
VLRRTLVQPRFQPLQAQYPLGLIRLKFSLSSHRQDRSYCNRSDAKSRVWTMSLLQHCFPNLRHCLILISFGFGVATWSIGTFPHLGQDLLPARRAPHGQRQSTGVDKRNSS